MVFSAEYFINIKKRYTRIIALVWEDFFKLTKYLRYFGANSQKSIPVF